MKKPNNLTRILSVLVVLAMLLTLGIVMGTTASAADCEHTYVSEIIELTDAEKEENPYAIGKEVQTCSKCANKLIGMVYVNLDFASAPDTSTYTGSANYEALANKTASAAYIDSQVNMDVHTENSTGATIEDGKLNIGAWVPFWQKDNLNLVSKDCALDSYTISFDVNLSDSSQNYIWAMAQVGNIGNNLPIELTFDTTRPDGNGGYEVVLTSKAWGSTTDQGASVNNTGYYIVPGATYSFKLEFVKSADTSYGYDCTLSINGEVCGTYSLVKYTGTSDSSVIVFSKWRSGTSTYDNYKVTGAFTEVIDPATCPHPNWETGIAELTDDEKEVNPHAIGREELICSRCGETELGNSALYEYMSFDTEFGNHANLTPASTPSVSDGKWTLGGSLYITDSLHLVSRGNSVLKDYSISFDVIVNHDPSAVDYDPSTNTGSKKPPIFFALIDGSNKWDYKNPSLGLDKTSKDANGGYELRIYRHNWSSTPSTSAATGFYMELGKEYSIKMDFLVDGSNYNVTLSAKAVDSDTYTSLVTYALNGSYGTEPSYIYFEGAGNVFDNFKISGAFTEVIDPDTCPHPNWETGIAELTDEEKVAYPYAIGREARICSRCDKTELLDIILYEYMPFDTEFGNHANLTLDSVPSVADGKWTLGSGSLFITDSLHLVSRANSVLKNFDISFDVIVNKDPSTVDCFLSTQSGANKAPIFFALIDGKNMWDYKAPALGLDRETTNDAGGYELRFYAQNWNSKPWEDGAVNKATGFFVELGKEYSFKMKFALSDTYEVTLYAKAIGDADYTNLGTYTLPAGYSNATSYVYFEGQTNVYDNFKISAVMVDPVATVTTEAELVAALGNADITTIKLGADITLSNQAAALDISRSLTITSADGGLYTITRAVSGFSMFKLSNNATVTLTNVILDGAGVENVGVNGGAFNVSSGHLIVNSGATIKNFKVATTTVEPKTGGIGGAIYCAGTLTINGGTISGNNATHGRGIHLTGTATLVMTDGKITGNGPAGAGWTFGGGIRADAGSTVWILGGEISENVIGFKGAGIYSEGTVYILGGTIKDNEIDNNNTEWRNVHGWAVIAKNLYLLGGEITGNTVTKGYTGNGAVSTFTNGHIYLGSSVTVDAVPDAVSSSGLVDVLDTTVSSKTPLVIYGNEDTDISKTAPESLNATGNIGGNYTTITSDLYAGSRVDFIGNYDNGTAEDTTDDSFLTLATGFEPSAATLSAIHLRGADAAYRAEMNTGKTALVWPDKEYQIYEQAGLNDQIRFSLIFAYRNASERKNISVVFNDGKEDKNINGVVKEEGVWYDVYMYPRLLTKVIIVKDGETVRKRADGKDFTLYNYLFGISEDPTYGDVAKSIIYYGSASQDRFGMAEGETLAESDYSNKIDAALTTKNLTMPDHDTMKVNPNYAPDREKGEPSFKSAQVYIASKISIVITIKNMTSDYVVKVGDDTKIANASGEVTLTMPLYAYELSDSKSITIVKIDPETKTIGTLKYGLYNFIAAQNHGGYTGANSDLLKAAYYYSEMVKALPKN